MLQPTQMSTAFLVAAQLLCSPCVATAAHTPTRLLGRTLADAASPTPVLSECPSSGPGTIKLRDVTGCNALHCVLTHACDPALGVYKFCFVPVDFDPVAGDVPNDGSCQLIDSESKEVVDGPLELDPNVIQEEEAPAPDPSAGVDVSPDGLAPAAASAEADTPAISEAPASSPAGGPAPGDAPGTALSPSDVVPDVVSDSPAAALSPLAAADVPDDAPVNVPDDSDEIQEDGSASAPRAFVPDSAEIPAGSVASGPDSAARHIIAAGCTRAVPLVATAVVVTGSLWW